MSCDKINRYIAKLFGLAEYYYLTKNKENSVYDSHIVVKIEEDKEYELDEWMMYPEDYEAIHAIEEELKKHQEDGEIKKVKVKSDSCIFLGHEVNWSNSWWCNLQFDFPTQVHLNCDCKNCPDFKAYEYEASWTTIEE